MATTRCSPAPTTPTSRAACPWTSPDAPTASETSSATRPARSSSRSPASRAACHGRTLRRRRARPHHHRRSCPIRSCRRRDRLPSAEEPHPTTTFGRNQHAHRRLQRLPRRQAPRRGPRHDREPRAHECRDQLGWLPAAHPPAGRRPPRERGCPAGLPRRVQLPRTHPDSAQLQRQPAPPGSRLPALAGPDRLDRARVAARCQARHHDVGHAGR